MRYSESHSESRIKVKQITVKSEVLWTSGCKESHWVPCTTRPSRFTDDTTL